MFVTYVLNNNISTSDKGLIHLRILTLFYKITSKLVKVLLELILKDKATFEYSVDPLIFFLSEKFNSVFDKHIKNYIEIEISQLNSLNEFLNKVTTCKELVIHLYINLIIVFLQMYSSLQIKGNIISIIPF